MQSTLKHCDTPYWSVDLHSDHDFAALGCGRWSLIIVKRGPFEAFLRLCLSADLRRYAFRSLIQAPF